MENRIDPFLIAPCGMNCGLCMAYGREKNPCAGCNGSDAGKPESCKRCIIKNCSRIATSSSGFCYSCEIYPCARLKQLDKRYRTKYHMSMLENLSVIADSGIDCFIEEQRARWRCRNCGGVICVHRLTCFDCGERMKEEDL